MKYNKKNIYYWFQSSMSGKIFVINYSYLVNNNSLIIVDSK